MNLKNTVRHIQLQGQNAWRAVLNERESTPDRADNPDGRTACAPARSPLGKIPNPSALKAAVSLIDIFAEDGHEVHPLAKGGMCLCPFHQEQRPSCQVFDDGYKCYACGETGDTIDYLRLAHGMSFGGALRWLENRIAGKGESHISGPKFRSQSAPAERKPLELSGLTRGTKADWERLAELRRVSLPAVERAADMGLIQFNARFRGHPAWIVTDRVMLNAQARRLDGKPWDLQFGPAKAYTLPGSRASWPIGITAVGERPRILLVEGGPDLMAAIHFVLQYSADHWAPVAMLGAGCSIAKEALPLFKGKEVRIIMHVDDPGRGAGERWHSQLHGIALQISGVDLSGLCTVDGSMVKDLNDATELQPSQFLELEEIFR